LYEAIGSILEDYSQEIKESLDAAADQVSQEALENLKADSPVHKGKIKRKGRERAAGTYRKGWKREKLNGRYVIRNGQFYLMYLLENGHALRRGGRTIGHVGPIPHVGKNADKAVAQYEGMVKRILDGDLVLKEGRHG